MSRRGGRNRKPGRREPNGRLRRKSQSLEAAEVRQTVMAYRRKFGLSEEDAQDPRAVDVFGRLALKRQIHPDSVTNARLYAAGELFRRTREAAQRALRTQRMKSAGDLETRPAGYDTDCGSDFEYVRLCDAARRLDDHLRARVLDRAGRAALAALVSVICEDEHPFDIAALRAGLSVLAAEMRGKR